MLAWFRNFNRRMALLDKIERDIDKMAYDLAELSANITAFTTDELNPKRKAASDKLGEAIRKRMLAEDLARRHTTGEI